MIKRSLTLLMILLITTLNSYSQTGPEITVNLLGNDRIAEVNLDQDKYINSIGALLDLMKTAFAGFPKDQKIAVLLVCHKAGKPTIELYSKPKINSDKEQAFLKDANALKFDNTKIVDLPVALGLNIAADGLGKEFKELVSPAEKARTEYENASLREKYELNKAWAINEVLPVLSAYETIVDEKFAGVKNFGKLVAKTNFSTSQDIPTLTNNNADYWRAILEMNLGNQLISATNIFIYVSQGELDHAGRYLGMINYFSDPKSITDDYLTELTWRLQIFNQQLNIEIKKGINEHDKGNFKKATEIYDNVLAIYPNSAWASYELYYSKNSLDVKSGEKAVDNRSNWDAAKPGIYRADPLYTMDVRASNAKEGYLLFRRQQIDQLFKDKAQRLSDIYKYANIAMDLGVYDFAAQLFWFTFTNGQEADQSLGYFLYCIEKLGITNLKENFKGDWEKEFKKIEAEKEKEMKDDPMYKAFRVQ